MKAPDSDASLRVLRLLSGALREVAKTGARVDRITARAELAHITARTAAAIESGTPPAGSLAGIEKQCRRHAQALVKLIGDAARIAPRTDRRRVKSCAVLPDALLAMLDSGAFYTAKGGKNL